MRRRQPAYRLASPPGGAGASCLLQVAVVDQEYDYEDVRSGGYRWYRGSPQVVIREIMGERSGWASVRELGDALRAMAPARVASKPRARRAKPKARLSK